MHHRADHLARREELAAVVVLLAHLQQQALVDLREREEVRVVDMVDADLVDLVEDVEQVGLGVDAHPLHRRHDLADDALLRRGAGVGQLGRGSMSRPCRCGSSSLLMKSKSLPSPAGEQFLPLPAEGLALVRLADARARLG